ncbi:hypothetical protein PPERSA_07390 [Pseudocohnilembus persalinus]|uniref:Transmembrane protein n=1 Tax=Pseudocohnilembus persalinus TaxID=266149 RepID=A0A0V0QAE9_PSEPJ|nr:hypothetical protein PPERSA_07390 [Pseudocohnilembus persalinus]|eukprot:KRW99147.1 hypothetical protein PPERSA_07390 [Pseudocohnilembus persalinus]
MTKKSILLVLFFIYILNSQQKDLGHSDSQFDVSVNVENTHISHEHTNSKNLQGYKQNDNFHEQQGYYTNNGYGNQYNNYNGNNYSNQNSQRRVEEDKHSWVDDVVVGAILFFCCFLMLILNERRFVKTGKRLQQAYKICEKLNPLEIDPNTQGKLICASCYTECKEVIFDPKFAVNVTNSMKLYRKCEMYQWQEIRKTRSYERNGKKYTETYYEYKQDWYDHFIDANQFHQNKGFYQNNQQCFFEHSDQFRAQTVHFGAFRLSQSQIDQCNKKETIPISQDVLQTGMTMNRPQQNVQISGNYLYFSFNTGFGGGPQLGDFRVSFSKVPCSDLTVVTKQTGDTFEPWQFTKELGSKMNDSDSSLDSKSSGSGDELDVSGSGCCGCCGCICQCCKFINKPIHEIDWVFESEKLNKKQVFKKKANQESTRTNLQRFGGWVGICLSIWLMLSPVYSLLYWFPWVGKFLGSVGSFICGLVGFILGSLISGLTIGIAWIWYRPYIGIPLMVICSALLAYIIYAGETNDGSGQPAA